MRKSLLAVTIALAFCAPAHQAFAQQAAIGTGGAGGAGGTAQGGSAAGGAATNSNTLTTTGGSGGGGGQGGTGGTGGMSSAGGGNASATGVQTGSINSTGNNQAAEITVNYITPVSPGGLKGLAAGVDPETGHFVNDTNVRYSGTQKIKNTPDAPIAGPASGPCNGFSGGIGVSVPGFAVGANTSTVDPGCTARETARIAAMLGRMDIANAVLENTDVVQAALKAKAARVAAAEPPPAPVAAPAQSAPAQAAPARPAVDREAEEARLKEQQRFAVEALQRKATMDKVYDSLTFTDAVSQASERTPQQAMAEEATKKLVERNKRAEEQLKLERKVAAMRAEPAEVQNRLEPLVPNDSLAQAQPQAVSSTAAANAPAAAPVQQAAAPVAQQAPVAQKEPVAAAKAQQQPALDPVEAAKLLRNTEAPPPPRNREPSPPLAKDNPQLASQPTLQNVKVEKLSEIFGFKKATEEGAPDAAARKPAPKATEAAAKTNGLQAANQETSVDKPPGDIKKAPIVPADALNFARAPITVQ